MSRPEPDSFNPYTAPLTGPETSDPFLQEDTQIRQQFIDCEANCRSIAELLLGGGLILAIGGAILFAAGTSRPSQAILAVLTLLGCIQFIVGIGARRFLPRARIGAIIFCALWLLFFPVETIFGGACLWYLVRPAAAYVFTEEYSGVIRRTPHVRFRTSAVSWGILVVLMLSVFGLFFLASG